jgi:hypothetical protein
MSENKCPGTISVSRYTRGDGTEVSGYERSCPYHKDGSKNADDTKNIKENLYNLGYYKPEPRSEPNGKLHGIANDNLTNAIKSFQKDNDLPATGRMNDLTRDALSTANEKLPGLSGLLSDKSISELAGSKVIGPLVKNYYDMKRIGNELKERKIKAGEIDNYYHSKAFYESGQKGLIPGRTALAAGVVKEWFDTAKNMTRKDNRLSWAEAKKDRRKDLRINRAAYNMGRKQPNIPFEESELHRKYETNGMNLLKKILNK